MIYLASMYKQNYLTHREFQDFLQNYYEVCQKVNNLIYFPYNYSHILQFSYIGKYLHYKQIEKYNLSFRLTILEII